MIWWILAVLIIITFMVAPSFQKMKLYQRYYTHRGLFSADQSIRENSLEAFGLAIKHGYGIELDVRLSKDQEVVVFHDDNLKRLFGKDVNIRDLTLTELREYDIPSFEEVLQLVDNHVGLIVELKSDKHDKILCEKVAELLGNHSGSYCVESFDPRIVAWFKKNQPNVMRGQLIMPIKKYNNLIIGLFVNSLLYQVFTRPHFLAVNVDSSNYHPLVFLNKLLGVQIVKWTVHKDNVYQKKSVQAIIFEHFKPTTRN